MQMKDAVVSAKRHIRELYADEDIDEIGLEEIEFDEASKVWDVTIGFRRPWRRESTNEVVSPLQSALPRIFSERYRERWYKLVQLADSDGKLLSVKDRILKEAA